MREPRSSDVRVSIAEYLRDEDARSIRHEHLRGELYAVSGGTARHSQIAANIITHLHGGVRSTACAVYTSDFRVQPSDEAVYYPDVTQILGEPVYRRLVDVPGDIDIVNVFRRPEHIPPHVDDILAKRPRSVWMQLGIRNDDAAEQLARAGIEVVQDRCLKVELMRMGL